MSHLSGVLQVKSHFKNQLESYTQKTEGSIIPPAHIIDRMDSLRSHSMSLSTSTRKPCTSCSSSHHNRYIAGDEHWSKVLQANELDLQSLPSSIRAIIESKSSKKSKSSIKKFCSRVSRFLSRNSSKRCAYDSQKASHDIRCQQLVLDTPNIPSSPSNSVWDRVSLQSVDSCYSSQPPTPSKCSSVSSSGDVEPASPSFFTCKFPPKQAFQHSKVSTPKRQTITDSVSIDFSEGSLHRTCTWPPIDASVFSSDEAYDSVFSDSEDEDDVTDLNESIRECTIPYEDLKFGKCLREGATHDTYRGRWHGEVLIHKYKRTSEESTAKFWKNVEQHSKLRHENISLFMGVCPEPENLTVITSAKKGPSLHESIHQKRDKLSLSEKVIVARQIAQGLGYLHDKGYVLENMNSENIHLESKVKISLVDQWTEANECSGTERLSYVAPELSNSSEPHFTKEGDIYAFGTVLFELFAGSYPTSNENGVQSSRQARLDVDALTCPTFIKNLIKDCWHVESTKRPRAVDISKKLQVNVGLQKRHSSSEPERLYKAGTRGRSVYIL